MSNAKRKKELLSLIGIHDYKYPVRIQPSCDYHKMEEKILNEGILVEAPIWCNTGRIRDLYIEELLYDNYIRYSHKSGGFVVLTEKGNNYIDNSIHGLWNKTDKILLSIVIACIGTLIAFCATF